MAERRYFLQTETSLLTRMILQISPKMMTDCFRLLRQTQRMSVLMTPRRGIWLLTVLQTLGSDCSRLVVLQMSLLLQTLNSMTADYWSWMRTILLMC